ncbi:unnamed protein product [Oppiella nova]|uniref:Uncharacterized protein n=1 Tax=Oppiella nova TaxID=334625 RepID=A0A7R9MU17_9ACAR|nr:unnamed protein product [Oppiella nova]CAG2183565.1 unnamed protein product [Oppiella nova]
MTPRPSEPLSSIPTDSSMPSDPTPRH